MKSTLEPKNRSRAKAYAARFDTTTTVETISELACQLPNGADEIALV